MVAPARIGAGALGGVICIVLASSAGGGARETRDAPPAALCGSCHRLPPADVLPKAAWRDEVIRMQRIQDGSEQQAEGGPPALRPDMAAALTWYDAHAPAALAPPAAWPAEDLTPVFARRGLTPPQAPPTPVVSDVELIDLDGDARLELVVCDMRHGLVFLGRPYDPDAGLTPIAQLSNPARSQVVDLDRDGIKDLLVADLGEFLPRDHDKGAVVWLRGLGDGRFAPSAIGGLPRVADVEAADFDGDGDLDLLVSAFGYRKTGSVQILENLTTDWSRPAFTPHPIDPRPGAVRAMPTDIDGDGRPDVVAVLSQDTESVIVYHNDGGLTFHPQVLYQAPHPNWGSSGMSLADLDGDGDTDILLANGDTFDDSLLKPYHGVAWLSRLGKGRDVRFAYTPLAQLPGPHAIVAADLDGDGDQDVIASALVAGGAGDDDARLPGLVWLERQKGGRFARHTLKRGFPRHAAVAAGDYDLDGDTDLVLGYMATTGPSDRWVEVWENKRK
jgi:hypothetical protein